MKEVKQYKIVISGKAKRDLNEIYEYIANNLEQKTRALSLVSIIHENISSLSFMPERFKKYDILMSREVRILPVKNYLIIYAVEKESMIVEVFRVLYSKRNYMKFMR